MYDCRTRFEIKSAFERNNYGNLTYMTYLALVAIIVAGAFAAFQHYLPLDTNTDSAGSSLMDPIEAAKQAARQLEGDATLAMNSDQNSSIDKALLPGTTRTMMVAGGCFWCVESDLEKLSGVQEVVSGYAGGSLPNPNYQNYATGGHKEVVEVTYDPAVISFEEILIYALKHMDPTDGTGSFNDRGTYYGPAFYYSNEAEKKIIDTLIKEVNEKGPFEKDLAVVVAQTPQFYKAEDYHQDYRNASGRDAFIEKYWGSDTGATLSWRKSNTTNPNTTTMTEKPWLSYVKPSAEILKTQLDDTTFKVTQEDGTERAGTSPLDKNYERGIYVDVLSGEPLFSSRDKYDSGTGWPSFVRPIEAGAVTEHEDNTFFSKRVEIRSKIADNHLGHVFTDGPRDRGGMRYCMNGVALKFIPERDMQSQGYGDYISSL